jgi:hypothetical protein
MSIAIRAQDMIHARYFILFLDHSFVRLFFRFFRKLHSRSSLLCSDSWQKSKKNDIVEDVICDNNQNTSLNVVSRQNFLDNFRQSVFCMFFFHIFKFNQDFMINSIFVNKEDDYEQIWLTMKDKSAIQSKKHFDFIKKTFEQIRFDIFQTFHNVIFDDKRRRKFNIWVKTLKHTQCFYMITDREILINRNNSAKKLIRKIFSNQLWRWSFRL